MNAAVALAGGFVCGFCSSAPVGPINIWVASSSLTPRRAAIPPFLAGVVLMDLAWAGLAQWGAATWLESHDVFGRGLGLVGGVVLLWLGIALWRRQRAHPPPTPGRSHWSALVAAAQGIALCASTPALPAFWVLAIASVSELAGPMDTSLALTCFLAGIAVGDVLWFSIVVRVMAWMASGRGGDAAWDAPLFVRIYRGAGAILILLGITTLASTIAW